MKKALVIILTLLTIVGSIMLTGCGGVAGEWKLNSLSYLEDGIVYSYEVGEKMRGVVLTEDICKLIVNENGTYSASFLGDDFSGKWYEYDDVYFIDYDDTYAIKSGKNITLFVNERYVVVLKK